MRPLTAVALLLGSGCAVSAVIWWGGNARSPISENALDGESDHTDRGGALIGVLDDSSDDSRPSDAEVPSESDIRTVSQDLRTPAAADLSVHRGVSWPMRPANADVSPALVGEPEVPVRLAFRALWYLGVDPEAERTWSRSINDPRHPPGVRSDLIVDMIDEGYTDNNHPTKEDLPVILARLEIIERYAPYAMDQVNADAFEQAYEYLLGLYIRLGGEPRDGR